LLAPLPEAERDASWHLVRPGGEITSRGAVGADLMNAFGHRRAALAADRASGVAERLYEAVAGHRDVLGRFVPDGPAPRRFP